MCCGSGKRPDCRGVTSMELALVFGVFILFVLGVVDVSRYLIAQQELTVVTSAVARQGAAVVSGGTSPLVVPPNCPQTLASPGATPISWPDGIANYAPMLDSSQLVIWVCVSVANTTVGSGLSQVTATGTYTFSPITPFLSSLLDPMIATVTYNF